MRVSRRPAVKAALVASIALVISGIDFWIIMPLQTAGTLDRFAVVVNELVTIINLPGLMVGRAYLVTNHHVAQDQVWLFNLVVITTSAAIIWLLALLRFRARLRAKTAKEIAGRRAFIKQIAGWSISGGACALAGYSVFVEPRWVRINRRTLPLPGLPRRLDGFRVIHLTDLHLGRYVSEAYLAEIVRRCNGLKPDLVVLTGDYIQAAPEFVPRVARILSRLRSRFGTAAVLGNHDHWEGAALCRRSLGAVGITLLDNDRVWVGGQGLSDAAPPDGGLCVAGVGDLWEDRTDIDAALGGVAPNTPRLLLSHNPDYAETWQARQSDHRVDLMLAGHTHGGQVRLPGGSRPITPSRYGQKYAAGLVQGPRFPVFVSTGVGMTILPVRFAVRPEIALFDLRRS